MALLTCSAQCIYRVLSIEQKSVQRGSAQSAISVINVTDLTRFAFHRRDGVTESIGLRNVTCVTRRANGDRCSERCKDVVCVRMFPRRPNFDRAPRPIIPFCSMKYEKWYRYFLPHPRARFPVYSLLSEKFRYSFLFPGGKKKNSYFSFSLFHLGVREI